MEASSSQSRFQYRWIDQTYGHGPISVLLQSLLLGGFHNGIPLPWKVLLESVSKVHDSMIYKAKNEKERVMMEGREEKVEVETTLIAHRH
jgi:hypothetical protein